MLNSYFGAVAAFLLAALPGQKAVALLRKLGAKQNVSVNAPAAHSAKQGTPTMGGLLILLALTVTILAERGYEIATNATETAPLIPLLILTLAFGAIGFLDDFLSAKRGKNLGLRAREKLLAQCLAAVAFLFWQAITAHGDGITNLAVAPVEGPFSWLPHFINLHNWYYPIALLFIVGFSNATNITDGLDGLSSGITITICLAMTAIFSFAAPGYGFFTLALAGALAGFLWWNAPPAKMFMGDTGSLALGAGLAGAALLAKCEIPLIIASLVCWVELASVMIQVIVFKWRKKTKGLDYAKANRVFRRAPLHHHFEELDWPETQVVIRFWIVSALCAGFALLWK